MVVNYNGRRYEVLNDTVVSEYDRLLVKTVSDYEIDQIFTHRADDTNALFRSNGELVVTFAGTFSICGTCRLIVKPVLRESRECVVESVIDPSFIV